MYCNEGRVPVLVQSLLEFLRAPSPAPSPAMPAHPELFGSEFWDRFFTSAGFGGAMAVVAAMIAAMIAVIQFRHAKSKDRDTRWWETLTWVYDRTVVEDGKNLHCRSG